MKYVFGVWCQLVSWVWECFVA